MRVISSSGYERRVRRFLSPEARAAAEGAIVARPEVWPVIRGTGGARKARVALPGRGKSGGARVIYFYDRAAGVVAFMAIYAKSEKENLSNADKNNLKEAIGEIRTAIAADDTAR